MSNKAIFIAFLLGVLLVVLVSYKPPKDDRAYDPDPLFGS